MSDILSQEEIDALKDAVSQGEVESGDEATPQGSWAETYDFLNRNRHLMSRLPGIKFIYSGFSGFFTTAMAGIIHLEVGAELTSVQQIAVGELLRPVEGLNCFCMVKHAAAKQPILIIMDSILLISFVDALCGGDGRPAGVGEKQDLGTIERRLLMRLAEETVRALEQSWNVVAPASLELQSVDYQPQMVASLPRQEVVEVAVFQVGIQEVQGELTIALPHGLIEAVRGDLLMDHQESEELHNEQWARNLGRSLQGVLVSMSVELARGKLDVKEFFNLKVGDVVYLSPHPDDKLVVSVERVPKLFGMSGTVGKTQAVQITSRIE